MTREQAEKRLKALGLTAEILPSVTSPERRAAAAAERERARDDFNALTRRMNALLEEHFGSERKAVLRRLHRAEAEKGAYKITLHQRIRGFDHILDRGDTWEEAFKKFEARSSNGSSVTKSKSENGETTF